MSITFLAPRAPCKLLTPTACAVLALMSSLAAAPVAALAQDQRIEITGSSIKRIDGETALPVQVITREAIDKTGATTAAELMRTLTANNAPLSDGVSITDGTSGQRGFNGANLRGLGVSSTLILLNGRRLANFATPGDNSGVDLNNIPVAALARVEVLTDGASAIYGTEAIGGVINFITKKDYQGIDIGVYALGTQEGGAGKRTATLSGGVGDLAKDGFNVFGVVDLQQLDALRSTQRQFIQDRPLASNLPALMSSRTFPANIRLTWDQVDLLAAQGVQAGGVPVGNSRTVNFSAPGCNPPASVYTPDGPGGENGCSYDYMQDTEIYPDAEKIGFLGRATLQINPDHQLFAEALFSRTQTTYVLSPNPIVVGLDTNSRYYPAQLKPLVDAGDSFVDLRLRMTEAGNRSNEVTSDASRIVIGATGFVAGWDYDAAISRAENKATDRYVNGYVLFDQFEAAVADGTINPFGPSDAAGLARLNDIRISDDARKSKGVSTAIDGRGSRPVFKLGGGDAMLAIGGEVRRETTEFTPSALLLSNNIAGDRNSALNPGEVDPGLAATDDSRNIASLYGELITPFSKQLEAQWALRYDHYSGGVGSTVNPKAGVNWRPMQQMMLRGSAGTGFRAPSLADLNRPTVFGTTSSLITDPQCAEVEGTIDGCTDQWNVRRESNPDLKSEKSRQFSLGTVVQPVENLSFNVDYFYIKVKDIISTLGEQTIINNPAKYNGTYITRDADGFISEILLRKENQGELTTSGIDVGVDWRGAPTSVGRFSAVATGTYVLEYDRQFGAQEPAVSNLGRFLNDQVIQRWRHRITLGWDYGDVGLTLANSYSSGYTDQNTTYDPVSDSLLPARKVESYSLWDLTGSWNATKSLKLRAGVLNLLDTEPPFSNQAYYFLAGYDPTYTDPRGRSYYVSLNYSFK
jgi:iron complex outermembrane recepter protein